MMRGARTMNVGVYALRLVRFIAESQSAGMRRFMSEEADRLLSGVLPDLRARTATSVVEALRPSPGRVRLGFEDTGHLAAEIDDLRYWIEARPEIPDGFLLWSEPDSSILPTPLRALLRERLAEIEAVLLLSASALPPIESARRAATVLLAGSPSLEFN